MWALLPTPRGWKLKQKALISLYADPGPETPRYLLASAAAPRLLKTACTAESTFPWTYPAMELLGLSTNFPVLCLSLFWSKPDLGRKEHTVPLRVWRVLHQNCFWRDLPALSLSTPCEAREQRQTPRGEKKRIKGFSFPRGGRTIIRVTERRSKRAAQSKGAGSFSPRGWTASQWSILIANFYAPHICGAYIPPN